MAKKSVKGKKTVKMMMKEKEMKKNHKKMH